MDKFFNSRLAMYALYGFTVVTVNHIFGFEITMVWGLSVLLAENHLKVNRK